MLMTNQLLHWPDPGGVTKIERILWMSQADDLVVVIDIYDRNALPESRSYADLVTAVTSGNIHILSEDPYTPPSEPRPRHAAQRDSRWAIIQPFLENHLVLLQPSTRGTKVAERAEDLRCSKVTIYDCLRRFWQRGQTRDVLLPDWNNCGKNAVKPVGRRPQGMVLQDKDRENIAKIARRWVFIPKADGRLSLKQAHQLLKETFYLKGEKIVRGRRAPILETDVYPSLSQFRYVIDQLRRENRVTVSEKSMGEKRFKKDGRPKTGHARGLALGPGDVYMIDSTIADVYLRSKLTNDILERPTLYFVIDLFSQMIVGFHVTLEHASYLAASLALESAFRNKVDLCREYGVEIELEQWPCEGACRKVYHDRGPELLGPIANNLMDSFYITIANAAGYRADWKPSLEGLFDGSNREVLHRLPGAVRGKMARGDRDNRTDAALTIEELRVVLIEFILWYNATLEMDYPGTVEMMKDKVDYIPLTLWNWGIKKGYGALTCRSLEYTRLHLLPGGEASITQEGLKLNGLHYSNDRLLSSGVFVANPGPKNGRTKSRKVQIAFDPREAGLIYLRPAGAKKLEPCTLTSHDAPFAGCSWYEVEAQRKEYRERRNARADRKAQLTAERNAITGQIVKEAQSRASLTRGTTSKRQELTGLKRKTADERRRQMARDRAGYLPQSSVSQSVKEPRARSRGIAADFLYDILEEEEDQ